MTETFFLSSDDMELVNKIAEKFKGNIVMTSNADQLPPEPTVRPGLGSALEDDWTVKVCADGTNTIVEIVDPAGFVAGEGYSRRRKGDRRSQELGTALAMSRAFADAAEAFAEIAKTKLG